MAHIQIDLYGKRLRLDDTMKKIRPLFNLDKVNLSGRVIRLPTTRAERLSNAESLVSDAKDLVQELHDEIEQWKSGMDGTNLESTGKYQELEECESSLQEIIDALEGCDFGSTSFPSMY